MRSQGDSASWLVFNVREGGVGAASTQSRALTPPSRRARRRTGRNSITTPIEEAGITLGDDDGGGIPGPPWQYGGSDGGPAYKDPALPK